MLQRLALCRTFLHDPDLLLLDEPFDGLDVEGADLLQTELAERTGVTALVATHDPEALAHRASARLALA
jgi:ABC-type multidrug transport system ATPase subunit